MENMKLAVTILEHIKEDEIPASWKKKLKANPNKETFRITLEPESELERKLPLCRSSEDRNKLLSQLKDSEGNENSEEWIQKIKASRTISELKTPQFNRFPSIKKFGNSLEKLKRNSENKENK